MIKKILSLFIVISGIAGCATNPDGSTLTRGDDTNLEYYNRAMFNFNYQLDKQVLKPIAKGYKKITTQSVRNRVTTFFNNLEEPAYFANNLLQGEIKNSTISVGRFVINSTLGLVGLFDVASGWGLEKKKNGFDATLAKYCVADGPFFVLPILGPSTPRYLVGWGADSLANPTYWALLDADDDFNYGVWGATGLKIINKRAENLELLDGVEASSVDFYAAAKSAFMQNREKFISLCDSPSAENTVPVYDFDFDDMDDE